MAKKKRPTSPSPTSKSKNKSAQIRQPLETPPTSALARAVAELNEQLRASGHKVTVREPDPDAPLIANFPAVPRKPRRKP